MLIFEKRQPEPQPIRITKIEIMNKKLNKVPSAGTKDDSEQKVENMQVIQHNAKPNVVCSPNFLDSCPQRRVILLWANETGGDVIIQDVDTTLYPAKLSNEIIVFG